MARRKMISEIDNNLINDIAEIWIESGGDAEGFEWSMGYILEAIREQESDSDDIDA